MAMWPDSPGARAAIEMRGPSQARNASGKPPSSAGLNATVPVRQSLEHEASREARERRDAFVRKLPRNVQDSVGELETFDTAVVELEAQFRRERRQLERRFEALYAPLLARRAALVAGERIVGVRSDAVPVPDFWLGAMKAETAVAVNVSPKDEPALKSLRDVTCTTLQEAKGIGFCLQFFFAPNKYFGNHVLSKAYILSGSDTEQSLNTRKARTSGGSRA